MSVTSKLDPSLAGSPAGRFGPHIEELHAFFETRGVKFGSPQDLKPFVDRLNSDAGFRDEIASMLRAIIYRQRDGLSSVELMELLAAAVGGPAVDDAEAPEIRETVRSLMTFVEGVFRARRNPGAASVEAAETREHKEPEVAPVAAAPVVAADAAANVPAAHATEVFYRARMVAEEEVEAHSPGLDPIESETVRHTDLHGRVPFEDFEDQETAERGSPAWLWVAGICALLLAFCAGLFVHQRLMVPLRDANTPYEAPPQEAQQKPSTNPQALPAASTAESGLATSAAKPVPVAKPSAPSGAPGDISQRPKYMAPATIGASQAMMASHLVYAPPPAYPMMAEMTRTQGRVMVEAVVGKDGRVVRAQAISGHRLLRAAAVREVFARRYRPYLVNDRPTDVATIVTVDFRLRSR